MDYNNIILYYGGPTSSLLHDIVLSDLCVESSLMRSVHNSLHLSG